MLSAVWRPSVTVNLNSLFFEKQAKFLEVDKCFHFELIVLQKVGRSWFVGKTLVKAWEESCHAADD